MLLVVALVVLWIYRPWISAPFAVADFSEFLPLLRRNATFVDRTAALIRYYAGEGRFNALSYAGLTLKWTLFGENPVAWQLLRAAQMLTILGGVYALIRRLGFSVASAATSACLMMVSSGGSALWTRLTIGEPLGFLCLLAAQHAALGYQGAKRWVARAVLIGVMVAAALLAKELLVAALPFLLFLGLCVDGPRQWRRVPRPSRRNVALAASVGIAAAVVGVAVLATLARSRVESFASNYGYTQFTLPRLALTVVHMVLPFRTQATTALAPLIFPANLLLALLIVGGVVVSLRRHGARDIPLLFAALSLPVFGAAVYLPWPVLLDYHVFPFSLGSAVLLALAVDELTTSGKYAAALARVASLVVLAYCTLTATRVARSAVAIRSANGRLTSMLVRVPPNVPVLVAVPPSNLMKPAWQWFGRGPTLTRYVRAVSGRRAPVAVDVACDAARELQSQGVLAVWYSDQCGSPGVAARVYRSEYVYRDWLTLRLKTDSLRIDVVNAP